MASSLPIWLAANILAHPRRVRWESADDGSLVYAYQAKGGKEQVIFWVTGDPEQPSSPPLGGADASAALDTFDIRAALMHLLYATYATELQRPWEEAFTLTAQQIADDLGLTRRRDMNQQDKFDLILHLARQPAQLLVHVYWPASGKREAFTVEQSPLWSVKVTYNGHNISSGNKKFTEIKIHVRAGPWAKYFLNQQDCKEGKLLYQYGYLSSELLKAMMSCWQKHAGAVRLMIWLLFRSRVGRPALNNVSTLMTIAYGQDALDQARRDRRRRSGLAKRWDNDLLVLHEHGCPIEFDPV